ncbi:MULTISPECIES: M48 family metallopeptidase [unclassified Sphingomonas]|uniref:M48 family metallopeptidase n=1 Tax=unclassified Sphingomonas TaxID=196159 RepID=UPI0006F4EFE5|nr:MULTISPECIES: SprT family zinc-dependent metalloprotease [unclassified Sphingomonas]KQM26584.1 metal-dependent hydrolase [Sphingomonas sp. Leaf9]KQM42990.1 metal-dependent hydrolase [Sphingomonas sp. Leaf11]
MIDGLEVVRHPRARVARLSVDPATGRVRLTVPKRMALAKAVAWAGEKADWIAAQRAKLPMGRPFVDGAVVPVADRAVRLIWREGATRTVQFVPQPSRAPAQAGAQGQAEPPSAIGALDPRLRGDTGADDEWMLVGGGPLDQFPVRIERWLKREALRLLTEDTAHYAAKAGVTVAKVAIGDPKARWGSCSGDGTIRYSWRLLLAPGFVRRATVAHEVAHRVHMHHGPEFHALVADLFEGDPDDSRRWLRAEGAALHWYGRASSSG